MYILDCNISILLVFPPKVSCFGRLSRDQVLRQDIRGVHQGRGAEESAGMKRVGCAFEGAKGVDKVGLIDAGA